MEVIDRLPRTCAECHHTAVTNRSRFLIKRFADPESELASSPVLIDSPTGRNTIPLGIVSDTTRHVERRQRRVVEGDRPGEIIGAKVDVTQHRALLYAVFQRPSVENPSCRRLRNQFLTGKISCPRLRTWKRRVNP